MTQTADKLETAMANRLSIDMDRMAVQRSVDMIMHLLHDFVPRHCHRVAREVLFDAFYKEGCELTNAAMRKEYEETKRLMSLTLPPSPPVI